MTFPSNNYYSGDSLPLISFSMATMAALLFLGLLLGAADGRLSDRFGPPAKVREQPTPSHPTSPQSFLES